MIDWHKPDYAPIYAERVERLGRLRSDPELLPALLEFYKTHPVEFIRDWGMTTDPRNAEIGLPVTVPFVLFPKQEAFIEWLYARWKNREDGLGEKSRDMGISWLCVAFGVWMWRFHAGAVIGFGSRKEEYVDKIGDPKSLFWKARQFINLLPVELRPRGYDEKSCAPFMRILNPENGAAMVGEAGDNIGRGNRTSIYFKDESAFYDHPDAIDAALSQTSNCKIDISTPNGNGNPFYRKRHSGRIPVFTFHWRDDPRKDDAWYERQKSILDPVVLAQEVDIDYNASATDAFIPGELVLKAQALGPADVEPVGCWIIGVDAAHMGNDEYVIHIRRGRLNKEQEIRRGLTGPQAAGLIEDLCYDLSGLAPVAGIIVELDGPGVSTYDHLRDGPFGNVVIGVHTGARLADDRNYNLRARMWRDAKEYLEGYVSLPNDPELKAQLASLKYRYKDSLLLMQDKKEYKKEFGRSPDRADAFVLTFAEPDLRPPSNLNRRSASRTSGHQGY
jgi:phage terminase large subunit